MLTGKQPNPWVTAVVSTHRDLRDLRSAVSRRLTQVGFETQLFEEPGFPVNGRKKAHEACLVAVNHADIVVLIIDKTYGGLFLGEGPYSITEEEYREAIVAEKIVIPCVRKATWEDYQAWASTVRQGSKGRLRRRVNDKSFLRYVEDLRVLRFLRRVSCAPYDDFLVLFGSVADLIEQLEGRIAGLSRSLCCRVVRRQVDEVMSQKTTTALVFSLGDVLKGGYFVEPPFQLLSGASPGGTSVREVLQGSLASGRSVLVLGEPGSGKSTIVAKAFLDSTESIDDSRSDIIPLYVNLRGHGALYHFNGMDFVEECCGQYFRKALLPLFDIRKVRPVYFMDGLDELTEDVTALNMDQVAEKEFFSHPFVISCRTRFAEDSLVSHRFGDRVDVVLRMSDWGSEQTWEYVKRFCRIRGSPELAKDMERAYRGSAELADVLHNPLLLTLFLWVVEESDMALPLNIRDRTSMLGEVLRLLVNREMARGQAGDPRTTSSVMRGWQLAAWELYRARVEARELTVVQLQEQVSESDKDAARLTGSPIFLDLLDTIPCSGYVRGMRHEVLWEFLVGTAIADGVENNRYPFPKCLEYVSRPEINRLVREIWARKTETTRRALVERLKDVFVQDVSSIDRYATLRRNNAAYYLGRMPLEGIAEELKALDGTESDITVKLSFAFSLVKLGDFATEEALWHKLDGDQNWDSYNRGYHLVYYRDISPMRKSPPFLDQGAARWDRTFAALLRHLTSEQLRHVALRRIELLTMRRFIESRHATGPLGAEEIEKIRTSMEGTPTHIPGFNKGVLDEFKRLLSAWKALQY